jgi:hypothetical protein
MAANEGLVLDSLNLNDGTNWLLRDLQLPAPKKRPEWAGNADSDGQALVRDPLFDNRVIIAMLEGQPQVSMNAALDLIGKLSDKLEEAEKQEGGLGLVWTPATSSRTLTFYVLSGEIDERPMQMVGDNAGYFQYAPVVIVHFDCKPFGYGPEYTALAETGTSSIPLQTAVISNVPGDVPAEARLIVKDKAGQNRRHVEWGLEYRYLDQTTSLLLDSDALVTTGFAGTGTTRTGAYDSVGGGSSVIRGTLATTVQPICGTGNQQHVGSYKVKARIWTASAGVTLRFSYRDGGGSLRSLDWVAPPVIGNWAEVTLGEITLDPTASGTQRWTGQVEALSTTMLDTIDIDYLMLIPTERYGYARTPTIPDPQLGTVYDAFNQSAGALAGKTSDIGAATWSGAGDADDFNVDGSGRAYRSAVSDADNNTGRYERVGSGTATSVIVEGHVDLPAFTAVASGVGSRHGYFARYTDTNNWVALIVELSASGSPGNYIFKREFKLLKRKTGTVTTLATLTDYMQDLVKVVTDGVVPAGGFDFHLEINTSGDARGVINGSVLSPSTDSDLATGGTLQTGGYGEYDAYVNTVAATRYFTYISITAPGTSTPEAVIFANQTVEFRSDDTIRPDSGGTVYGRPRQPRAARFYLPEAGDKNRSTRIAVKARRNDVIAEADDNVADGQTSTVMATPRYIHVPRS